IRLDDGRVAVCMGDATGHGAASAMMMAMTQSHLHAELRRDADPAAAVSTVNRYMSERSAGGRVGSLWVGGVGAEGGGRDVGAGGAGQGQWVGGGRGEPVRKVQSEEPRGTGIPVGIDASHEYRTSRLQLTPGDRLVVYSDGLVEQRDARGEQFGAERFGSA